MGSKITRGARNIRERAQLSSRRARICADDARGKERVDGRAVTRDLRLPAARLVGGAPLPRHGEGGQVALGPPAHRPFEGESNAGGGGQVRLPFLHERECGRAVRVLGVYAQQRLGEVGWKGCGAPIVQGAAHEDKRVHGPPIVGGRGQEAVALPACEQACDLDDALSHEGGHVLRFQPGGASGQRALRALLSPIEGYLQETPEHALVPKSARGQAPHERAQRFQRVRGELWGCQEREQRLVFEPHLRALRQDAHPPNHVLGAHGHQVARLAGRRQEGTRLVPGIWHEAGAGPVTHRADGHELARLGDDQRIQVRQTHDGGDALARQEAGGHVIARQPQRRPLHLRVREGEGDAEQGFEVRALHGAEAITQDPEHAQGVRLRPHERPLAAARKKLQVEAPGLREGGQLPDRQGDGRPDGRGHEGAQGPLTGLGLVIGHGKQAQGARMPAGARGRQVSSKHVEEGVDEAIPVDEPLVGAGSERARPAGRPPRAHGGRTVGGGQ